MNVFFVDANPVTAAQSLHDKHVVKMAVETAQMISTAISLRGGESIYRATHINHPCTRWVADSEGAFCWAAAHLEALNDEYRFRWQRDRDHRSYELHAFICDDPEFHARSLGLRDRWIEPPQCMPDMYRVPGDTIAAYRRYYEECKAPGQSWTRREPPPWLKDLF